MNFGSYICGKRIGRSNVTVMLKLSKYNAADMTMIYGYAFKNQHNVSFLENVFPNRSNSTGSKIIQRNRSRPFFGSVGI